MVEFSIVMLVRVHLSVVSN